MTSTPTHPTQIELGCGSHKRAGFFGIDIAPGPEVDLVMDIERQPLPFPDASVDYIYSSHAFEHLEAPGSPIQTLREIVRVARHGATVEIWTPYGKSNDALLLGHRNFYTEAHWQHICYLYDSFYLGDGPGRFVWERTQYVLWPDVLEELAALGIPLEFALTHLYNVALEFGVFLTVDKHATQALNPQHPMKVFGYSRTELLDPEDWAARVPIPPDLRRYAPAARAIFRRVSARLARFRGRSTR